MQHRSGLTALGRLIAAFALVGLLAVACSSGESGSSSDTTTSGPSGTLRIGVQPLPASLDPQAGVGDTAPYVRPVFEGLVININGTYEPLLATEWSTEGNNWTFTLREGVTFTDDTPFDADVVVANLERNESIHASKATNNRWLDAIDSVTATDQYTVTFTLNEPFPNFLLNASTQTGMMMSPKSFDDPDVDQKPVGTGPWQLDSAATTIGSKYVYTLNDDYWDPSVQGVERVEVSYLGEPSARSNALRSGEIDFAVLPAELVSTLSTEQFGRVSTATNSYTMLVQDRDGVSVAALGNQKVRQALAYSLDRDAFVGSVLAGLGSPSAQIVGSQTSGYLEELNEEFEFDTNKAKALLAEAGYADGFTFDTYAAADTLNFVTAYQGFFDDIGVTMNIQQVDQSTYISSFVTTENPVIFAPFPLASSEPSLGLGFLKEGATNPFNVVDPQVVALTDEAATISDPAERTPINEELNRLVTVQGWYITAAIGDNICVTTKEVTGVVWGSDPSPYPQGVRLNG